MRTADELNYHRAARCAALRTMARPARPADAAPADAAPPVVTLGSVPPTADVAPSHVPCEIDPFGPAGYSPRGAHVTIGADRILRPVVRSQGPWVLMTPYRDGAPVLHRDAPQWGENVAWCATCGAVGRTAADVPHDMVRTVPPSWRPPLRLRLRLRPCTAPAIVGCTLPKVIDGPDVLRRSVALRTDAYGRTVVTGPAYNGTGATVRPDVTPDMTARAVKGRMRMSRRRPDGGRITVAQLAAWVGPRQPVAWVTHGTDPMSTAHRAMVAHRDALANMAERTAVAAANKMHNNGTDRTWFADGRPPVVRPSDDMIGDVAMAQRTAAASVAAAERLRNMPDPTDDTVRPAIVGHLKADGTPYAVRTVRRSRRAVVAATAPAENVTAEAGAMVRDGRIG